MKQTTVGATTMQPMTVQPMAIAFLKSKTAGMTKMRTQAERITVALVTATRT